MTRQGRYGELTPAAVIGGVLVGLEQNMGIVSAAVFTGLTPDWTGSGSIMTDSFHVGEWIHFPAGFRLVFAASLLSLGAGFIAGRPGLAILYGTILNFWILIPVCVLLGWLPADFGEFSLFDGSAQNHATGDALANTFRNFTANKVGIGLILGGAIAGILIALPALKAALASLRGGSGEGRREEVSVFEALLLAVAGIAWLWLASLVVAQTTGRTDWSPLSGLALIAIAILVGILGPSDPSSIVPAVTLGAAICVITSMCAGSDSLGGRDLRVAGVLIEQRLESEPAHETRL